MTQVQNQQAKSSISRYLLVLILAVLPVAIAIGQTGADISGILSTMTGSAYPIAFTLMSWGIAAKLIHDIRK